MGQVRSCVPRASEYRVESIGFRVQDAESVFRVHVLGLSSLCGRLGATGQVQSCVSCASGCRDQGSEFRVQGPGSRVLAAPACLYLLFFVS